MSNDKDKQQESVSEPASPTDDRPVGHPSDDRLGYSPFARHLSETLVKMVPGEGLVIGLYGPWGSGKTTILNLVEHYLTEQHGDPFSIMHFNPWWFSTPENLVQAFLSQLLGAFERGGLINAKTKKLAADTLTVAADAPLPWWATAGAGLVARLLGKQRDLHALRTDLETQLRKQKGRTLVIVDDVDRLNPDEIRHLFRLIKAVGNLPRVTYLVAFDRNVVVKAIEHAYPGFGHEYLQKIVQVPFELPPPDVRRLHSMLFEKLVATLGQGPDGEFDQRAWANVFLGGIQHFIRTPRHAVQFANSVAVSYPPIRGEVHTVDFLAIEALKVFAPAVYGVVRSNPDAFSGTSDKRGSSRSEDKALYDAALETEQEKARPAIKEILERVFPRCQAAWGGTGYGYAWLSTWRKDKRACTPELLPIYFSLQLPTETIGSGTLDAAIQAASSREAFGTLLRQFAAEYHPDGATKAHALLARLEDYTESGVPKASVTSMYLGLLDAAETIERAEPDRSGFYEFGVAIRIQRLLYQLLERLEPVERFETLRQAVETSPSISTIAREVVSLGRQHGRFGAKRESGDPDPLLPRDHVERLETLLLERLRTGARDGSLARAHDLPWLLRAWIELDEPGCREWIETVIHDPRFVASFLNGALSVGFRYSEGDHVSSKYYMIDLGFIGSVLDPERMRQTAIAVLEDPSVQGRARIAVERFIEELNKAARTGAPRAAKTQTPD